jgi:hypothetical protein
MDEDDRPAEEPIQSSEEIIAAQVGEFQNRAIVFRRYYACLTAAGFTDAQAMRLVVAFQITLDRK